jgi:hypothetical protein
VHVDVQDKVEDEGEDFHAGGLWGEPRQAPAAQ